MCTACYIQCSQTVHEHRSLNPSRASWTRHFKVFLSRASHLARSQRWNSHSGSHSPLGSHVCILSQESCHPQHTSDLSHDTYWKYKYTWISSYCLNFQYESRRLSWYFVKLNIDHLIVQLEDGRTDGRNQFRPWNQDTRVTRQDDIKNSQSSVRPMSSYRWTIANPESNAFLTIIDILNSWLNTISNQWHYVILRESSTCISHFRVALFISV